MKAIIFGASGQDGHYLSALLKEKGYNVVGITRQSNSLTEISDYTSVDELIKQHKPAFVFHLAANSTTSHEALFENHATIATGTLNILEAVKRNSPITKVFISGSGLQFKNDGNPIKETDPFEARDAYSVSRIQSVSEAAKRIAVGSNEKLAIGDIDAVKEYTYAGDIVRGIWAIVNQDKVFEANISSGEGYSIKEWLEQCFSLVSKDWQEYVVANPDFVSGHKQLVSDPTLIFSLGWRPEVSFEELAKLMMK